MKNSNLLADALVRSSRKSSSTTKRFRNKNAFQKATSILGTFSVPNPGTRLVPRLVRFLIMRCSIVRQGLTHRFRRPCNEFLMPLLAIWAAQHFNASLPASMLRAFISEPNSRVEGSPGTKNTILGLSMATPWRGTNVRQKIKSYSKK